MKNLSALLKSPDFANRSHVLRMIALALAVLTPLLVAGVTIAALSGASVGASGRPNLPAAVVNLDLPLQTTVGGKDVTVVAGKLLTDQLMSTNDSGFSWTITDADHASTGLAAGTFSAVVTIPADFSKNYISSQGTTPVAANLEVQTNGAQSYVSNLLATALSSNVQAALSTSLTQAYVKGLLGGFTQLHSTLGSVASNTQTLADGAGKLATVTGQTSTGTTTLDTNMQLLSSGLAKIDSATAALPKATKDLNDGAQFVTSGTQLLAAGLGDTVLKQGGVALDQLALDAAFTQLQTDLPTLTPAQIADRIADLKAQSTAITAKSSAVGDALTVATVGTAALGVASDLVAKGTAALADSTPTLSSSLAAAASGAAQLATGTATLDTANQAIASGSAQLSDATQKLATGLDTAATSVPSYADDAQTTLSTVIATPITTTVTDSSRLPSALDAVTSIMVPVALWAGAFALYLVLVPFTRLAFSSVASTGRIVRRSLAPALVLGLIQAVVVLLALGVLGVTPGHRIGSAVFVLVMSVAFVALHQGLVALFGRVGRMLSLAFLALQVVAAGVLLPAVFSPAWYQSLASVLPLSAAVTGFQAMVAGGDVESALSALVVLVIAGAVGVALTVIAVARRRGESSLIDS